MPFEPTHLLDVVDDDDDSRLDEPDVVRLPRRDPARLVPLVTPVRQLCCRQPRWLWPGWIPAGRLTVLDGNPDAGKSLFLIDLAARVSTTGVMPDGSSGAQGNVVLMVGDCGGDAVRPRLQAAGADIDRIQVMQVVHDGDYSEPLVLPRDLPKLRAIVVHDQTKLLIIDPLFHFLKGDVPATLQGLEQLATETGCAIVLARHLTRGNGREPLYRGVGPQAIITAASAGLLLARDPEVPERRVLFPYRNKLGKLPLARTFTLEMKTIASATGPDGKCPEDSDREVSAPYLVWGGTSDWSAAELLTPQKSAAERPVLNDACRLLEQATLPGPVAVQTLREEAHQLGISAATLQRAKQLLGLKSRRQGIGRTGFWHWSRADSPPPAYKFAKLETDLELTYRDRRPGDPLSWPASPRGRAVVEQIVTNSSKYTEARLRDTIEQLAARYCYTGYDDPDAGNEPDAPVRKLDSRAKDELLEEEDFDPEEFGEPADRPSVGRGVARADQVGKNPGKKPVPRPPANGTKPAKPGLIQRILDSLSGR
jgi:hypothetical protein